MCTVEAFFARGALMTTTAPMVNDDADLSLLFQRLSFVVSAHFFNNIDNVIEVTTKL